MRALLLLLGISALLSCKKEVPTPVLIQFGDDEGMLIKHSGRYLMHGSFKIDINNDGFFDIQLNTDQYFYPVVGVSYEASIESLHPDCEILVEEIQDTTYVRSNVQLTTNSSGDSMFIQATTYSCEKVVSSSVIDTIEKGFILDPKSTGDQTSILDDYRSITAYFTEFNSASMAPTGYVNQGIVYYSLISYYNDCSNFPLGITKYIGVKINTSDGIKLGWIELRINSGYHIKVYSWAIQS